MRHLLAILLTALTLSSITVTDARAGQIWTDGNGDGLPDTSPLTLPPNTDVTIGLWVDAQSFTWTNYLAYIEWTPGSVQFLSATYVVTGGSNFPIDDFSHPNGVGFGGNGFSQGGVDHIGNVTLRITSPLGAVTPIIDIYNPFYVFSQLGSGTAYQLFTTNPGTALDPPPPQTGACCLPDFSCAVLSEADCAANDGIFMGNQTLCSEVFCPDDGPSGACCFPDRSCQVLPQTQCDAMSGVFMGLFTSCAEVSCGPPFVGACCLPDGACQIMIESDCVANGGTYAGNDVACADANCPPPTGACCFCPGGFCEDDLTPEDCIAAGGIFVGSGTTCAINGCGCPDLPLACCFPDGSCIELSVIDCLAQGGITDGSSYTCSTVECVPANSVEPKSWGKIKSLFR
ncbi:MAG: hypothetical protein ACKVU1_03855 [bacterium]